MVGLRQETERARTLELDVPGWPGHLPGQHVDVRLTAADGYRAQRAYSLASPPEAGTLSLTVVRLEEGEVSPYLTQQLHVGDLLELRGPLGGYFVWEVGMGGPLLLLAGGAGIVPLMAMLRHRAARRDPVPVRLLYSCRAPAEAIYRAELDELARADPAFTCRYTFTRCWPPDWPGDRRRLDVEMLAAFAWPAKQRPLAYLCGPSGFVEAAATALGACGYPAERIRTERFGPSGDAPAAGARAGPPSATPMV